MVVLLRFAPEEMEPPTRHVFILGAQLKRIRRIDQKVVEIPHPDVPAPFFECHTTFHTGLAWFVSRFLKTVVNCGVTLVFALWKEQ